MNLNLSKKVSALLFYLMPFLLFSQSNIYVKVAATGDGSGSSWENATTFSRLVGPTNPTWGFSHIIPAGTHVYIAAGSHALPNSLRYDGGNVSFQGGYPANATQTDLTGYDPATHITEIVRTSSKIFDGNYTGTAAANVFMIKGLSLKNTSYDNGKIFYRNSANSQITFTMEDCTIKDNTNSSTLFNFGFHKNSSFKFHNNQFSNINTPFFVYFGYSDTSDLEFTNNQMNNIKSTHFVFFEFNNNGNYIFNKNQVTGDNSTIFNYFTSSHNNNYTINGNTFSKGKVVTNIFMFATINIFNDASKSIYEFIDNQFIDNDTGGTGAITFSTVGYSGHPIGGAYRNTVIFKNNIFSGSNAAPATESVASIELTTVYGLDVLADGNQFKKNITAQGSLFFTTNHRNNYVIKNNKFENNTLRNGAGVHVTTSHNSSYLIENNDFVNNTITADGGGIYITGYGIGSNDTSEFVIRNNIISCNKVALHGGAIYATTVRNLRIEGNTFSGNSAGIYGGALYLTTVNARVNNNNKFIKNYVRANASSSASASVIGDSGGGAIFWTTVAMGGAGISNEISNNTFVGNYSSSIKVADIFGGGAVNIQGGIGIAAPGLDHLDRRIELNNNIFVGNYSNSKEAGAVKIRDTDIINSISDNTFLGNAVHNPTDTKTTNDSHSEFTIYFTTSPLPIFSANKMQLEDKAAYSTNNLLHNLLETTNTYNNTGNGGVDPNPTINCDGDPSGPSGPCVKPPLMTERDLERTTVGISTIKEKPNNWPLNTFNGALILHSKQKGFVITRVDDAKTKLGEDPSLKGALLYDKTTKCFKLFDGLKWDCLVRTCDD